MNEYKLVAPHINSLLDYFDRFFMNPYDPSEAVYAAMDPLFRALQDLAPLKRNSEAKSIWIRVPRGTIEDYASYEDLLDWGVVNSRDEYERHWREIYPDPENWYELIISEAFRENGSLWFRAVSFGNKPIINAHPRVERFDKNAYTEDKEEAAVALCGLLVEAAEESMQLLREGKYNEMVRNELPYQFRTGVVLRRTVWERIPKWRDFDLGETDPETLQEFKDLMDKGVNDEDRIGRLKTMTANDFFKACAIGYEACGYEGTEKPLVDQYFLHADGRDEGLTGRGDGLNAGPGIDFDDPGAWEEWFFRRAQHGGHPWEVCRGGNSTHVDLFVRHDKENFEFQYRLGKITEDEYTALSEKAGYYFVVGGTHRAREAVHFYTALNAAGYPVVLREAEEILSRLEGTGYIGIVPHSVPTRYCESMFPKKYGDIIDFTHVFETEMEMLGDVIEWLPEEEARLLENEDIPTCV